MNISLCFLVGEKKLSSSFGGKEAELLQPARMWVGRLSVYGLMHLWIVLFYCDFRFLLGNLALRESCEGKNRIEGKKHRVYTGVPTRWGWRRPRVTCPVVLNREILNDGTSARNAPRATTTAVPAILSRQCAPTKRRKPCSSTVNAIIFTRESRAFFRSWIAHFSSFLPVCPISLLLFLFVFSFSFCFQN